MTEKRFEPKFSGDMGNVYIGIQDNQEDDLLGVIESIDKLNELNKKIKQLKQKIKEEQGEPTTTQRFYISQCSTYGFFVNDTLGELPIIEVLEEEAKEYCKFVSKLHIEKQRILKKYKQQNNILKQLNEENKKLKEQIKLIANAHTYTKQESVKEILRHEIWGIDSVAGESADAFHEYCVLSKFFKEHYGEDWDNFE